jgi:hypothetical protein
MNDTAPTLLTSHFRNFLLGIAAACLAGCATETPLELPKEQGYRIGSVSAEEHATARGWIGGNRKFYWDPEAPESGSNKIVINLPVQKAFYYRDDKLVGATVVSTGREGHSTPSGTYRVISKHEDHRSSLYGGYVDIQSGKVVKADVDTRKDPAPAGSKYVGAEMPYFLRLKHQKSGITSIGLHAGYLPGYPASHGCIRLPKPAAERFFNETGTGTPVYIENAHEDKSEPPATAPMLTPLIASTTGPAEGQPKYAPGSRKAKAAAKAAEKARKNNIKQNGGGEEVAAQESRPATSGSSVNVADGSTRYLQN